MMKIGSVVTLILGVGLLVFAVYHFVVGIIMWAILKLIIAAGLIATTFVKNRYGMIIFGHLAIVAGCILVTAGIYYVPIIAQNVKLKGSISVSDIFLMPLFWGFISVLGGICANYHGFCKCVRKDWKAK